MGRTRTITQAARDDLAAVLEKHGLVIWGSEWYGVSKAEDAHYDGPLSGCGDNLSAADVRGAGDSTGVEQ